MRTPPIPTPTISVSFERVFLPISNSSSHSSPTIKMTKVRTLFKSALARTHAAVNYFKVFKKSKKVVELPLDSPQRQQVEQQLERSVESVTDGHGIFIHNASEVKACGCLNLHSKWWGKKVEYYSNVRLKCIISNIKDKEP